MFFQYFLDKNYVGILYFAYINFTLTSGFFKNLEKSYPQNYYISVKIKKKPLLFGIILLTLKNITKQKNGGFFYELFYHKHLSIEKRNC